MHVSLLWTKGPSKACQRCATGEQRCQELRRIRDYICSCYSHILHELGLWERMGRAFFAVVLNVLHLVRLCLGAANSI